MQAIHELIEAVLADPKASKHHALAEAAKGEVRPTKRSHYVVTEPGKKPYESKDLEAMAGLLGLSVSSFRVYMSTNGGMLTRNGVKIERKKY